LSGPAGEHPLNPSWLTQASRVSAPLAGLRENVTSESSLMPIAYAKRPSGLTATSRAPAIDVVTAQPALLSVETQDWSLGIWRYLIPDQARVSFL
jgi:hypothetical protein